MDKQLSLIDLVAAYGDAKYNQGALEERDAHQDVILYHSAKAKSLREEIERRIESVRQPIPLHSLVGDILDGKE